MTKKTERISGSQANLLIEDMTGRAVAMPQERTESQDTPASNEPLASEASAESIGGELSKDDVSSIRTQLSNVDKQTDHPKLDFDDSQSDDTMGKTANASSSQPATRRVSTRQRKLSLEDYRATFLQVPHIVDRKPVFISGALRDRVDDIVRRLGGRHMSVSGMLENLVKHHLDVYGEDLEYWRRL